MSLNDVDQVHHMARLAVLAMSARGVAGAEFETSDEVQTIVITIFRPTGGEQAAIDLGFFGTSSIPLSGMSL
jgi:hypothetical protein